MRERDSGAALEEFEYVEKVILSTRNVCGQTSRRSSGAALRQGKSNVDVRISIETQAKTSAGFDEALQRAVKENCNILRFSNAEFEDREQQHSSLGCCKGRFGGYFQEESTDTPALFKQMIGGPGRLNFSP